MKRSEKRRPKRTARTAAGILMFAILSLGSETASLAAPSVNPPKKIYHDDKQLLYNPRWKDKEIFLEDDLYLS